VKKLKTLSELARNFKSARFVEALRTARAFGKSTAEVDLQARILDYVAEAYRAGWKAQKKAAQEQARRVRKAQQTFAGREPGQTRDLNEYSGGW
jgi:hypothetical protein